MIISMFISVPSLTMLKSETATSYIFCAYPVAKKHVNAAIAIITLFISVILLENIDKIYGSFGRSYIMVRDVVCHLLSATLTFKLIIARINISDT